MSSHRISFNPVPEPCNCPLYPCWFWRLRAWIAQAAASVILFISVCNRCLKKSQHVAVLALAVIAAFILLFPPLAPAEPCNPPTYWELASDTDFNSDGDKWDTWDDNDQTICSDYESLNAAMCSLGATSFGESLGITAFSEAAWNNDINSDGDTLDSGFYFVYPEPLVEYDEICEDVDSTETPTPTENITPTPTPPPCDPPTHWELLSDTDYNSDGDKWDAWDANAEVVCADYESLNAAMCSLGVTSFGESLGITAFSEAVWNNDINSDGDTLDSGFYFVISGLFVEYDEICEDVDPTQTPAPSESPSLSPSPSPSATPIPAGPCAPVQAALSSICSDSTSTAIVYYSLAKVVRVIDGDTAVVHCLDKIPVLPTFAWPYSTIADPVPTGIKVRFLCVDSPESVHPIKERNNAWGVKASKVSMARLQGRYVTLLYESNVQSYDIYGRLLAYVILDGRNYCLEMVQRGISPYTTIYGRSAFFHEKFRELQANAYAQRRGLWADPSIEPAYHRYLLEPD